MKLQAHSYDSYSRLTNSAVSLGLPGFDCMGETALHYFASRGDAASVQRILPKCNDAAYIMKTSKFRLTKGLDALHTALIFQELNIADAILERLEQIWREQEPKNGVELLTNLLRVRDPVTRTTTTMLMCRLRMLIFNAI